MVIKLVQKRDGSLAAFDAQRITASLQKALAHLGAIKLSPEGLVKEVITILEKACGSDITPTTKDVEDVIFEVLEKRKLSKVWQQFSKHKKEHAITALKTVHGIRDDLALSKATILAFGTVLKKNEQGQIIETPKRCFGRVASALAQVEKSYSGSSVSGQEEEFLELLTSFSFLPDIPIITNAGSKHPLLLSAESAHIQDSTASIFSTLSTIAQQQQQGIGAHIHLSALRPKGSPVGQSDAKASGPVAFMKVFDLATRTITGGKENSRNSIVLDCSHPDILEFSSRKAGELTQYSRVVVINAAFFNAVHEGKDWNLTHPKTKKTNTLLARDLFEHLCTSAKEGLITLWFSSEGESLQSREPLTLGFINLARMGGKDKKINLAKLKRTIRSSIHLLNNVLDTTSTLAEQEQQSLEKSRRVGLGVIGFAELLIELGIPYDNPKAKTLAHDISEIITQESLKKSSELGLQRGSFIGFSEQRSGVKTLRNASLTHSDECRGLNKLAHVSAGLEPLNSVAHLGKVEGAQVLRVHPLLEKICRERGLYRVSTMMSLARKGHIDKELPPDIKKLFITTQDIKTDHILRIQAAYEQHTDGHAHVGLTLPEKTTEKEFQKLVLLAVELGCKGITVGRRQ